MAKAYPSELWRKPLWSANLSLRIMVWFFLRRTWGDLITTWREPLLCGTTETKFLKTGLAFAADVCRTAGGSALNRPNVRQLEPCGALAGINMHRWSGSAWGYACVMSLRDQNFIVTFSKEQFQCKLQKQSVPATRCNRSLAFAHCTHTVAERLPTSNIMYRMAATSCTSSSSGPGTEHGHNAMVSEMLWNPDYIRKSLESTPRANSSSSSHSLLELERSWADPYVVWALIHFYLSWQRFWPAGHQSTMKFTQVFPSIPQASS